VKTAKVVVTAVDGYGNPLSGTMVTAFINAKGDDVVALFRSGSAASNVPFGRYRISVQANEFREASFDADIASPEVPITVSLEWYGLENARVTMTFRGKLAGYPAKSGSWWCKASGLYSRMQYESAVRPSDMTFDFGEVPNGFYVLSCVADRKFVVLRVVRPDGNGGPLTITFDPKEDVGTLKE
jgi:hypothetical protein